MVGGPSVVGLPWKESNRVPGESPLNVFEEIDVTNAKRAPDRTAVLQARPYDVTEDRLDAHGIGKLATGPRN